MTPVRENKAKPGQDLEQGLLALKELKSMLSSVPVNTLITIADEIAKLRTENERLQAQARTKSDEVTGLIQHSMNQADSAKAESLEIKKQLDEAKREKTDTEKKLAKIEAELKQSVEKAAGLEAKHKQEKQELEAELKDREEVLEELRGYCVELKDVAEHREELNAALETIRTEAMKLATTYFGVELRPGADNDLWKKANVEWTGLQKPPSSPDLAKRMRVALMLFVVSRELRRHIFQPAYLPKVQGIDGFMEGLAKRDPEQESHLRSVLLKTKTENPKTRISSVNRRVDQVVHESFGGIANVASIAIPDDKLVEFEKDLLKLCETAYDKWTFIQTLQDHIRPDDAIISPEQEENKWSPLTFADPSPSQAPKAKQPRANNGNNTASAQTPPKKPQPSTTGNDTNNAVELSSIVVWPAFVNTSYPEEGIPSKGLVLPRTLLDAVKEDLAAAAAASPPPSENPHREMRAEARSRDPATQHKRRSSIIVATANGNAADSKKKGPSPPPLSASSAAAHGNGPSGA
ncbi:hypothetical protein VTH06DRAFT_969 [Thermothelomyces fergusii]